MGSSIIYRAKGFFIPDQLKQLTLTNLPKGFGIAIVKDGLIEVSHGQTVLTPTQLAEIDKGLKEQNVLYTFNDYPDTVPDADLQPFMTLLNAAGKVVLVCAVDGDFKGYDAPGTPHPSDYCMHEQVVKPMTSRIYRLCKEDLAATLAELKLDDIRAQLMQTHIGRGHVTFLGANGDIFSFFTGNKAFCEYPWGWTSNNYGYTEGQAPITTQAAAAPEQPKSLLGGLMASIGIPGLGKPSTPAPAAASAVPAKPAAIPSGPKIPIAAVTPLVQPPSSVSAASVLIQQQAAPVLSQGSFDRAALEAQVAAEELKVPKDLRGKPLKGWFRNTAGHLPSDYQDLKVVTRSKKEVQRVVNRMIADAQKAGKPIVFTPSAEAAPPPTLPGVKNVEPVHIQAPKPDLKAVVGTPNAHHLLQPFLSAEEKKALNEFLNRPEIVKQISAVPVFMTDKHVDPQKYQTVERKTPSFWQAAGLDGIHNIVNWDLPMWSAIAEHNQLAVLIALLDFRDAFVQSHIMLDNVTAPSTKQPEQPAPKPVTPTSIGIPGLMKAG